jgi:hypothetical protein
MASEVQWRRGTAAENDAFTGAAGEITVDTTNDCLRLHDGSTAGGTIIPNSSAGHTQNTDTGTDSTTFQLDTGNDGPQIKNNSDVLEVRNDEDDDYLPIKAASYKTGDYTLTVDETKAVSDKADKSSIQRGDSTFQSAAGRTVTITDVADTDYHVTIEQRAASGYVGEVTIKTKATNSFVVENSGSDNTTAFGWVLNKI